MNRRDTVIALLALSGAPFSSVAQQQNKVSRVGFLSPRRLEFVDSDYYYGPFMRGMRELGYVDGKNLIIEWRSAEGNNERLPNLATELVNLKVDVIVAVGTPGTRAAQKATTTIPIVMVGVGDPVGSGFVKNLPRPASNITGLSLMTQGIRLKQLEVLLDMMPKLSRVAVLVNPSNTDHIKTLEGVRAAAQKRGVKILVAEARTPQEIDNAFSLIRQQNAGALLVFLEPLFTQQKSQIAALTAKHRLPSIAGAREYAEAGCLMSYGSNIADGPHRAATYVDKLLKGAKPADLPVEQPSKFELVLNLKTAKKLGLNISRDSLARVDEVIQ